MSPFANILRFFQSSSSASSSTRKRHVKDDVECQPPPYEEKQRTLPYHSASTNEKQASPPSCPPVVANAPAQYFCDPARLREAATSGDIEVVLKFYGPRVDEADAEGWTALHFAAWHGRADCVEFLLKKGADPNKFNSATETPMHLATTSSRSVQVLNLLFSHGGDVNARTTSPGKGKWPHTVLQCALNSGHLETVRLVLRQGADINATMTKIRISPLHLCCYDGRVEIAKELLAAGCDIEAETSRGWTPLYVAVWRQHLGTVSFLLSAGAKPNLRIVQELDIPHAAAAEGSISILQELLIYGMKLDTRLSLEYGGRTPLHTAIASKKCDMVNFLLDAGADLHAVSASGATPVMFAATYCDLEFIQSLIAKGASLTTRTKDGSTILHFAVENANSKGLNWLLSQGLDVNACTTRGTTPLMQAALFGPLASVQLLLDTPSLDRFARDAHGTNALTCYSSYTQDDRLDIVKLLISAGLDPLQKDHLGYTARDGFISHGNLPIAQYLLSLPSGATPLPVDTLPDAVCSRNVDVVKLLLSQGMDVNARKIDGGYTPLHVATSQYNWELMELLLSAGANATIPDENGMSSIDYASLHSPTLEKLGAWAKLDLVAPVKTDRRVLLRASVQNRITLAMAPKIPEDRGRLLNNLGHSLLLLAQTNTVAQSSTANAVSSGHLYEKLALQAFDYSCARTEAGLPRHRVYCDACETRRPVVGKRWVCTVCIEHDFCDRCFKKYQGDGEDCGDENGDIGKGWKGCVGHRLLEISSAGYEVNEAWETEVAGWLLEVRKSVTASFIGM